LGHSQWQRSEKGGGKEESSKGQGGGQLRDTSFKERAGEEFGHLMENKKYIIFFFC